jgi:hypothetical protein
LTLGNLSITDEPIYVIDNITQIYQLQLLMTPDYNDTIDALSRSQTLDQLCDNLQSDIQFSIVCFSYRLSKSTGVFNQLLQLQTPEFPKGLIGSLFTSLNNSIITNFQIVSSNNTNATNLG